MKKIPGKSLESRAVVYLFICYFAVVAARFILALATSAYPTVSVDEFLYYSIARSIASEGKLLFRGQPADYSYILYPLCLSPVYLIFQEGADYYRLIQLWNILIMTSAVFPIYGLFHAMLKDHRALILTMVALLLPEFILGQYIFSEVIIYPLFYTVLYLAYLYIANKKEVNILFIGLAGALLYYAKPGAMVPAAVFLIVFLSRAIKNKDIRQVLFCIAGIVVFASVFVAFQLVLKYVFGYNGGILSIYKMQVGNDYGWHWVVFFKAIPAYVYYFILSCGIIGFAYPCTVFKYWDKEHKRFAGAVLISLAVMIIGTAWTINRHEYASETIHLRYISMYIPLFLLFSLLPQPIKNDQKKANQRPSCILTVLLVFLAVYSIVCGIGVKAGNSACYPFMSLSVILLQNNLPETLQLVFIIAVIACCTAVYLMIEKNKKNRDQNFLPHICAGIMVALMLVNVIFDYVLLRQKIDFKAASQMTEARSVLKDKDYIYVYTDERVMDYGLDINSRNNISSVTLNDMFNHLYTDHGAFIPFIPDASRGMLPSLPLHDTDTIVLDRTVFPLVKLSDDGTVKTLFSDNQICIARISPDKPMVSSIIGNIKKLELQKGTTGILVIYDTGLLSQPLKMRFNIQSDAAQMFTIFSDSETHSVSLTPGRQWYEIVFDRPQTAYNFSVEEANIILYGYELSRQDN